MNAATDRYEPPNALFNTRFQNAATSWNSFLKRKIIFFFSLSKIGAATADEWLQVQTYFTYFYHLTLVNLFLFKLTFMYHYLFTTFVSSLRRVQSVLRLYKYGFHFPTGHRNFRFRGLQIQFREYHSIPSRRQRILPRHADVEGDGKSPVARLQPFRHQPDSHSSGFSLNRYLKKYINLL